MKTLKHFAEQPFIVLVGFAALIHSTWTVSTMFSGFEPAITSLLAALQWAWWVLPGFLFAISLDVGMMSAAHSIRRGARLWWVIAARVITFAVMALFSYALQLVYLLHHVPLIDFGSGVSQTSASAARSALEFLMWVVPSMLPIMIVMYTFTDTIGDMGIERQHSERTPEQVSGAPSLTAFVEQPESDTITIEPVAAQASGLYKATCQTCGYTVEKDSEQAAQNALNGHKKAHRVIAPLTALERPEPVKLM